MSLHVSPTSCLATALSTESRAIAPTTLASKEVNAAVSNMSEWSLR